LAWVDMTLEARRVTCFAYIQDRALFSNVDSSFFLCLHGIEAQASSH
jgi:hypothetical protein